MNQEWKYLFDYAIPVSELIKQLEYFQEKHGANAQVIVIAGATSDERHPVRAAWAPSGVQGNNPIVYIDAY